jgi:hypothetical protein
MFDGKHRYGSSMLKQSRGFLPGFSFLYTLLEAIKFFKGQGKKE